MAETKVVVYAALAGNSAIAVTKFAAAGLTGSSAMLSEAVHSVVDSVDQLLLLVGDARRKAEPTPSHPFGYGLEAYFWGFTVALMVFLLGGAFSVYEGVHKLQHPEPPARLWVNYLVLGLSALFEGATFVFSYVQFRKRAKGGIGLASFIRRSKDPNLIVTLLEDGAALTGLAIAALGVTGQMLGVSWADAAASLAIGVLLMGVAAALANETRSLIAGEAADSTVVGEVRRALEAARSEVGVVEIATLQLGPERILVALTLDFPPFDGRDDVARAVAELTRRVRAADPRIFRVYFRPAREARSDDAPPVPDPPPPRAAAGETAGVDGPAAQP